MSAGKKVLFVDDEEDIREVVQIRLESNGYEVITAGSGEEALKKIEESNPDLMILDVMMPGMDGLTVLKTLRKNENTAKLPVIILTAKRKKMIGDLFELENIQGFIEKPFDSKILLDMIEKAVSAG